MAIGGFAFIPNDNPEQALRVRRLLAGAISYFFTYMVVVACWRFGFIQGWVAAAYLAINVVVNVAFYFIIRSGLNLRFSDPSLTLAQVATGMLSGLYAMYYAQEARGAFLILSLVIFVYGLFQFRTRDFFILTGLSLLGYALLLVLLMYHRPDEVNLSVELLWWVALATTLLQISGLGGYISGLRHKVSEKNQELAKRNGELEIALQRIHEMAIRDSLTGAFNRHHLMEMIALERQRCDRKGCIFSICLIDVDWFKHVNDNYGHLAGDEVLRTVARSIVETQRSTDIFGRYGGEEFVILLPDTMLEGALIHAENVRRRVEKMVFPDISRELHVTISIGVAEFRQMENIEATFQRADEALYRAKNGGRNRCMAESDMGTETAMVQISLWPARA
jgi:diguanylate cyclase